MKNLVLIIWYLVGTVVSFLLLFFVNLLPGELAQEIVKNVLVSIIGICTIGAISEASTKKYFETRIDSTLKEFFPFFRKITETGLEDIFDHFPFEIDKYRISFEKSRTVYFVMNDGKRVFSNNLEVFKNRFSDEKNSTYFILLDHQCADSVNVLTRKNDHEEGYYVAKIKDFADHLAKFTSEYRHKATIYQHDLYNTVSIILTDDYAFLSIYRISPGLDSVPHFVYKKTGSTGEYSRIALDVEKLVAYSVKKKGKSKVELSNI